MTSKKNGFETSSTKQNGGSNVRSTSGGFRNITENAKDSQNNGDFRSKLKSARSDAEERRRVEVARSVIDDFQARQEERRPFELAWLLGLNFMLGNQYSFISSRGEIETREKLFPWESREVFNHVAPIIESRLAKLGKVRPAMSVRPTGNEQSDIEVAKLSRAILDCVAVEKNFSDLISNATVWSEVCGTTFYKVFWNSELGEVYKIPHISTKNSEKLQKSAEKLLEIAKFAKNGGEEGGEFGGLGDTDSDQKGNAENGKSDVGFYDENKAENGKSDVDKRDKNIAGSGEVNGDEDGDQSIPSGDIDIRVISPFEIFPDSCASLSIDACESIIHAYPISAHDAEKTFGMPFEGRDISVLSLDNTGIELFSTNISNVIRTATLPKHNQVMIYEKYIRPNLDFPLGRLLIVAGDTLVFEDDLPLAKFPFVRQVSTETIGSFWGTSVIDRCIPLQRSYNAIKNRKYEFFSRLSAGVLAVEDGSVDIDNLEQEGLAPGKILVYRAGSNLPKFMDAGDVPSEFSAEEDRLLGEFVTLTGVSELMRNSTAPGSVSSGTAINLLIEQDDTRLSVPAENIRRAVIGIGRLVLETYKNFATLPRLSRVMGENGEIQLFYWVGSNISAEDVVLDTSNELTETSSMRKNMVLELLKNGILFDDAGRMSKRTKSKVLEIMGFGNWESATDLVSLHVKRASKENIGLTPRFVLEIDDHEIHIEEHTKFLLAEDGCDEKIREEILSHIREHRAFFGIGGMSDGDERGLKSNQGAGADLLRQIDEI